MSCFGSSSAQAVAPASAPASASASPVAAEPPPADAPAPAAAAVAVAVVVRIRPMIAREQGGAKAAPSVLSVVSDSSLQVGDDPSGAARADAASRLFTFDRVLGEGSTQDEAYRAVGEPILLRVLEGYNGCVFAYGQTASGKTFTMEGAASTNADASAPSAAAAPRRGSALAASPAAPAASEGVIPRLCARLCDSLSAREAAPTADGAPAFSWVLQAQ